MKLETSVHFTQILSRAQPASPVTTGGLGDLLWLLVIFALGAITSFLCCHIAKALFPRFRSGESKIGTHRADLMAGERPTKSIELPLVGGPAFMLAIVGVGSAAGFLLHFTSDQWKFLLIGLGAAVGYAVVGFIDDWQKVYRNTGLRELTKFTGVFLVGCIAAALYFFLLPSLGQEAYSIYKDLPILNSLLCGKPNPNTDICDVSSAAHTPIAHYSWLVFLMLLTGAIGSFTSLSVDFSDGLDGLAGGLVFSASLAMAIVVAGLVGKMPTGIVLEVLALLGAGAVLGYLPWNWPSAWSARKSKAKRRAKIYMGDCGALGLGGLLAITAIFSRNELLLIMIGGAFVLEGLSVLISARVLTRFFRRHLHILRFAASDTFIYHTEFPLPFLATPLHQHFDLLGWDRRRLIYGAWVLGTCFAALGALINLTGLTWQRYVIRFLIFLLAAAVWSAGSWSKSYFVGKHPPERRRRARLALYYGYPFRLMGMRMFHRVEVIEAGEDVIETPAEELALWQRMTIYDARSMLGLYCYRAGYYPAALAQWSSIPEPNRLLRPEIIHLLTEVEGQLAVEKQETQPMRRDQILKQEPILTGNLPLADLPNPYEPVSHAKADQDIADDPREPELASINTVTIIPSRLAEEENLTNDEEENQITGPLKGDML